MSHPEFLKQKFEKARVQGAQHPCRGAGCPCRGAGCPRKNPFFVRSRRRRAGREKRGTAPHPRQRAGCPLQSRLSRHLTYIERQFEKIRDDSCFLIFSHYSLVLNQHIYIAWVLVEGISNASLALGWGLKRGSGWLVAIFGI